MSAPPPPPPPPPSALPAPVGPRRVRRLTRWPVAIGAAAIILPAAAAIWAVTHPSTGSGGGIQQDLGESTVAANAAGALQHATDGAIQQAVVRTPAPSSAPAAAPATAAPPSPQPRTGESDVTRKMRAEAWASYYKAVASEKERHIAERVAALTGDTLVAQPTAASAGGQGGLAPPGGGGAGYGARGAYGGDLGGGGAGGNGQGSTYFGAHGPSDPSTDYSPYTLTEPLSDYEVKAGDIITGTMVGEANSDTPGEIVGSVSKPVFDYKTGTHVLIPQGTRIIASYNTSQSAGQDRLEVGIERLIYPRPCAQSLDLGRMVGSDISGNAGFSDETDNHYGKKFVTALLLAGISAGAQLSQPQQTTFGYPSTSQVAGGALGQQLSQLGIESARRGLDIPPTQRIRSGYSFILKLEKDIPFAEGYTCPEAGWVDGRPAPIALTSDGR